MGVLSRPRFHTIRYRPCTGVDGPSGARNVSAYQATSYAVSPMTWISRRCTRKSVMRVPANICCAAAWMALRPTTSGDPGAMRMASSVTSAARSCALPRSCAAHT